MAFNQYNMWMTATSHYFYIIIIYFSVSMPMLINFIILNILWIVQLSYWALNHFLELKWYTFWKINKFCSSLEKHFRFFQSGWNQYHPTCSNEYTLIFVWGRAMVGSEDNYLSSYECQYPKLDDSYPPNETGVLGHYFMELGKEV